MSTRRIAIYLEVTLSRPSPPRSAGPAGCRASRDEGAALEALTSYAEQYAPVVEPAGVSFPSTVASMSSSGCLAGSRPRSPHPNAAGQIAWHVVEHGWEMQDPGGAVDRGLKRAFGWLPRHPSAPGPTELSMMYHRDIWKQSGQPPSSPLGRCLYGTELQNAREEGGATVRMVTGDLISRARGGDGDAFRELTEPYRRELEVHCYRMLGSFQDAEDTVQDTLLAAWQGLGEFEGRASLRTWLYRIATNRCLNARRSASRRPAKAWDVPEYQPPEPSRLGEVVWLEPYPDALLEGAIDVPLGPEARYDQTESISLAFVTALQVLPPRQLAVVVLRDVLGFHTNEVAEMLESTVESVNSALKRARASLKRVLAPAADREPPPASDSPAEDAIVEKFVRAYDSGDLDALVALLTDDVFMSMPPMPFEYEGRDVVARFCASLFGSGRRFDLVRTRANAQPAFGAYLRSATGVRHGTGLIVLTLTGDRICAMTHFANSVFPSFGLPRSLPYR